MKNVRVVIACVLVIATHAAYGQTGSGYRNFVLGSSVASVSAEAKSDAASVKTIHERPALIQDLEWRPSFASDAAPRDPVEQLDFRFYDDQLYEIVITYDQQRTAGMRNADMVDAISTTYGNSLKPLARKPATGARSDEAEDGTSIARWSGADQTVVLFRSSDFFASSTPRYWLIVTSPRLDALARTASAQAIRMEEREAPQREAAKQQADAAAARAAEEKARAANKAAFRP